MSPEAWGFFSLLTTTTGGIGAMLIDLRSKVAKVDTKVDTVGDKADTAAIASAATALAVAPVTNGFAAGTTESLTELRALVIETRGLMVGHIADHASAAVRKGG